MDVDDGASLGGVRVSSIEGGQLFIPQKEEDVVEGQLLTPEDLTRIRFIPDQDLNGEDSAGFLFAVSDGELESTQHSFRFDVAARPDAPVTLSDAYTLTESGTLEVSAGEGVLANDTDVDGDGMTVTSFDLISDIGGTFRVESDGALIFVPEREDFAGLGANGSSIVSATYTATGAGGESATGEITITVTGENAAPTARDDGYSVAADAAAAHLDVLDNDSDPEGDDLAIIAAGAGAEGVVTLDGNSLLYTPGDAFRGLAEGETGTDEFLYTVSDGDLNDGARVTVTVTGVNDAPVARDDLVSVDEDAVGVEGNVLDNDEDPDAGDAVTLLNFDVSSVVGTIDVDDDGTFLYTPGSSFGDLSAGDTATETFTYTIQDDAGLMSSAAVTITVMGTNDVPIGVADVASTDEDTVVLLSAALDNDSDPDVHDELAVVGIDLADTLGVAMLLDDNVIEYDPGGAFDSLKQGESTTDVFHYILGDGTDTVSVPVTVTVTGANDAPTAVDDSGAGFTVGEDDGSFTTANVLDNDSDPDDDSFAIAGSSDDGTEGVVIDNEDGTFGYTLPSDVNSLSEGQTRSDTFTYFLQDGDEAESQATVTITIVGANDAPIGVDDSGTGFATGQGQAFTTANVLLNDEDPDAADTLSVAGIADPLGSVDGGLDDIVDSTSGSTTGDTTGDETTSPFDPTVGDTTSAVSLSTTLTLGQVTDLGNGTFQYDPNGAFDSLADGETATDEFTYIVSDGIDTDTAVVTILITGGNEGPTAVDDSGSAFSTNEDVLLTTPSLLLNDTDPDGDPLQVVALNLAGTQGTVVLQTDGSVTYDPHPSMQSLGPSVVVTDTFTYTVEDSGGFADTGTVTIEIVGLNDAPVAEDDAGLAFLTDSASSFVTGNVLANDDDIDDGAVLTVTSIDTAETRGSVTDNGDGTFTYDPAGQFADLGTGESAQDLFTYTINDGQGGTDSATVFIQIQGGLLAETSFNDNAGDDSWQTASNWSLGEVPATGQDVRIADNTVNFEGGTSDQGILTLDGAVLNVTSGNLSAQLLSIDSSSVLIPDGGSFSFGGVATINNSNSISGAGQLGLLANAEVTVQAFGLPALANAGDVTFRAGTNVIGGDFLNTGTARIVSDLFANVPVTVTGNVDNRGLITFDNEEPGSNRNETLSVQGGTLLNGGTIQTLQSGFGSNQAIFAENFVQMPGGLIDVQSNDLRIQSSMFDARDGTIDVADGQNLRLQGAIHNAVVTFGGDTDLRGSGTIQITGASILNLDTPFTLTQDMPTLETVSSTLTIDGEQLTVAGGAALAITGDTVNSDLNNQGTLVFRDNSSTLNGVVTNTGTFGLESTINANVFLTINSLLTNHGLITFDNVYDPSPRNETLTVTGGLSNAGTIRSMQSGGGSTQRIDGDFTNTEDGLLDVDHSLTIRGVNIDLSSGTVDVAAGQELHLQWFGTDSTVTLGSASNLTGEGSIVIGSSVALALASPFEVTSTSTTLDLSQSSMTISGSPLSVGSGGNFALSAETVNVDVNNAGMLTIHGNTTRLNQAFVNSGTLAIQGDVAAHVTLIAQDGFTNTGLITLDNVYESAARSQSLTINDGVLINDGTVRSLSTGLDATNRIDANFSQTADGILDLDHSLSVRSEVFDGSLGTIDVAAGQVLTFESRSNSAIVTFGNASTLTGEGEIRFFGTQSINLTSPFEVTDTTTSFNLADAFITVTGSALTVGSGGTFEFSGDVANVDVSNAGQLNVRLGNSRFNHAFTNTGTLALESTVNANVSLTLAAGFLNAGLITLDNLYASSTRSQILIVENAETLTNAGTIQSLRSGAGGTSRIDAEYVQTADGMLDVDQDLTIRGLTFDLSLGMVDVAAGQVLTLTANNSTGVTSLGSASTLTGEGTIRLTGTQTLDFTSPFELTSTSTHIDLAAAAITITGEAFTIGAGGTFELSGETVGVDLTNNGTLFIRGGTSTINSAAFANSGTLAIEATSAANVALAVANGFTNSGLISFDNVFASATRSTTLNVDSGSLVNDGTIQSLRSGAGGPQQINGDVTQTANGVIDVDYNLDIRGLMFDFSLGSIDVAAGQVLRMEATNGTTTTILGAPSSLTGAGTIEFSGTQNVQFADPFDIAATPTMLDLGTSAITLSGADLSIGSGGTFRLSGDVVNLELSNAGDLRIDAGTSTINSAVFANSGTVELIGTASSSVTLNVENGFTNTGTIVLDNEYASATRSQTLTINNGLLTNDGTIHTLRSGAGGTQRINADVTQTTDGLIDVDQDLTIRSLAFDGSLGAIDVAAGRTLTFEAQTSAAVVTLGAASTLTGDGAIRLSGTQTLDFTSPFELTATSTTLDFSPSFITVTGSDLTIGSGGSFLLTADAVNTVLNNDGSLTIQGGTSNLNGAFSNSGTLALEGTSSSSATLNVDAFTNTGTIRLDNLYASATRTQTLNIDSGPLINDGAIESRRTGAGGSQTINADVTQTANGVIDVDKDIVIRSLAFDATLGTINVETGHTLTLRSDTSSAVVTLGSVSNLTGDGRILFDGTQTVNLSSPFELTATSVALDFGSGNITVSGADLSLGSGGSLTLTNDTIDSNLLNDGTLSIEPGTSHAGGTVTNGGTLQLHSTSAGTVTFNLNNGLTNTGVIELDNTYASAARNQNLNVDIGTFVNDGTIRTINSGAGGTQTINAELTQTANGLIDVDKNMTIRTLAFDTSLGAINVHDGHTLTVQSDNSSAVTTFGSGMTLTGTGRILFSGTQTINVASPTTLPAAGATVDLGSGSVTVTGDALTIAAGATLPVTNDTINSDLHVDGRLHVLPGTSHFNGTNFTNTGSIDIEGTASGSSTININAGFTNDGTITLDNTYASASRNQTLTVTGGPIVNDGTISTIRTGAGGSQAINSDITQTATGVISIDKDVTLSTLAFDTSLGTVHVEDGHTLTISGQNSSAITTFGGATSLTGTGRVLFSGTQALNFSSPTTLPAGGPFVDLGSGSVTLTGSELTVASGAEFALTNETVNADLNNEGTLRVQQGTTTHNASGLMNSGTLAIEGTVSGSATYTVNTSFTNSGLLTFDNVYASAGRNQTFNVNGTLTNDGTIQTLRTGAGGTRSMTADVTQGASGLIDIDFNLGLSTLALDLSLGTLDIATGRTLAVSPQSSAALTTFAGGAYLGDGTLQFSGTQNINFDGAPTTLTNLTFDLVPGSITVGGTGSLNVDASATFLIGGGTVNTATIVNGGTFRVQNGTTTFNSPSITNNADMHIEGTVSGSATANFANGLVNNGTLTFDNVYASAGRNVTVNVTGGVLDNQGTLNVVRTGSSGTFSLTGTLDNSGSINIDKNITLSGSGLTHTNQAGATITVQDAHLFTISGTGSTFLNDGTMTLSGVSGVSAVTTVLDVSGIDTFQNNGSITGIGTVNGTVIGNAPTVGSSPGIVTINGDYLMGPGSEFEVELAGEDPVTGYDVLDVRDSANLDGALRVELLNGFSLREGATFAVLTAGLLSGGFVRADGLDGHAGLVLDLSYSDDGVLLTAVQPTISGDAGDNVLEATTARDIVTAGAGDDYILGLGPLDVAYGGAGDDIFQVESGFDRIDGGDGADTLVLSAAADADMLAMRVDRVDTLQLDGAEITLTPELVSGVVDGVNAITGENSLLLTGHGAANLEGFEETAAQVIENDGDSALFRVFVGDGVTLYADADAVADGEIRLESGDGVDLHGLEHLAGMQVEVSALPELADVLDGPLNQLDDLLGPLPPRGFIAPEVPVADVPMLVAGGAQLSDLLDVMQPMLEV